MESRDRHLLVAGIKKPLPRPALLRSGQLLIRYEEGKIRYVSFHGRELIRSIYSAVRDRNWGTIEPEIVAETVESFEESFRITVSALYKKGNIHFEADYKFTGGPDQTIVCEMQGFARTTFLKNRIGFCVLHPLNGYTGLPCIVESPSGTEKICSFPDMISPSAPMKEISGMRWQTDLINCSLKFEGDIWETEDQRNWTDSSYKTFCTPLRIPYPAEISAGTRLYQKVSLHVSAGNSSQTAKEEAPLTVSIGKVPLGMPVLGTGISSVYAGLDGITLAQITQLSIPFLRVDLWPGASDFSTRVKTGCDNVEAGGFLPEWVFHFSSDIENELDRVRSVFGHSTVSPCRIWFVDDMKRVTTGTLVSRVVPVFRQLFPGSLIGGGADAHFAEFNRNRIDAASLDFVSFAICPQVHAFDLMSLVENLEAQEDVVRTARLLYPGLMVHVSPVTLRQRFNVVATARQQDDPDDALPYPVDARQCTLFAAGWTLGSFAALSNARASAVTYYETAGWRGIVQGKDPPGRPELFAGRKGEVFPVYHLFRFIGRLKEPELYSCAISNRLTMSALAIRHGKEEYLLLANHCSDRIYPVALGFKALEVKMLHEQNVLQSLEQTDFIDQLSWESLAENQLPEIPAYGLAFIRVKFEQV